MRTPIVFLATFILFSCAKKKDIQLVSNRPLTPFSVTVEKRYPYAAVISWSEAENIFNADTVKYAISLNGKIVKSNIIETRDTIANIFPDSVYNGVVFARTNAGDTASASFELENIAGYIIFGDEEGSLNSFSLLPETFVYWRTLPTAHSYYFNGIPTIVDSTVYINSSSRGLFAINTKTGNHIWNTRYESGVGSGLSPVYQYGKIYTANETGIYSLNATTGEILWRIERRGNSYRSNPVISNGLLFVVNGWNIVAIDITSGKQVWMQPMNTQICINPVVYKDLLIFGGFNGNIYALNQISGEMVWTRDFSVQYSNFGSDDISPITHNNTVIVHSGNSGFYCLEASTGKTIWNYRLPDRFASSPAIGNGLIYFVSGGSLLALNASNGTEVWKRSNFSNAYIDAIIYAKYRLYFVWQSNWGFSIADARDGSIISSHTAKAFLNTYGTVVIGDSVFYVPQSGMVQ